MNLICLLTQRISTTYLHYTTKPQKCQSKPLTYRVKRYKIKLLWTVAKR